MIQANNKLQLRLVVLIIVVAILVACDGEKLTDLEYLAHAKEYIDAKKTKEASIELKNALRINPKNAEARWLLGKLYTDMGNGAPAEKELKKAIELGLPAHQVNAKLVKALFLQGKFDELLELETINDQYSKQDKVVINAYRARSYIKKGQLDLAEKALQEALKINEDSDEALLSNAYLSIAQKDLNQALSILDRAAASNSENIEVWIVRGDIYKELKQKEQAFESYSHVLTINPKHFGVQISIASAHLEFGEIDEADKVVEQGLSRAPKNVDLKYLQSVIRFNQGKYKAAGDGAVEVLKIVPEHAPSMMLNGATKFALGSFEEANNILTKIVFQYPGTDYARKLLAATALSMGDPQRALDTIKPMLRFAEKDPSLLGLIGEIYLTLGKPDLAISYFEKSTAIEPQRVEWATKLGRSRLESGDTVGGIRDLELASEKLTDQYQAETLLIITYMRQKNFDKAYEVTIELEKKLKDSPVPLTFRGAIYEAKQDFVKARQSYEKALVYDPSLFTATSSLARLDIRDSKKADAKARFKKLLDRNASETRAMLALADLEVSDGNNDEYINWLQKIIKTQPTDVTAYVRQALFYLNTQQVKKSISVAREAIAKIPNAAESHLILARAQLASNEVENAILSYKQVLSISGDSDPRIHLELSNAQLLGGDLNAARNSLKRALILKPDFLGAEFAMVRLLIREGQADEALQMATRMQKRYPESSAGYALAGDMFFSSDKFEEAEQNYRLAYKRKKDRVIALSWSKSLVRLNKQADAPLKDWLSQNPDDEAAQIFLAAIYKDVGKYDQALSGFNAVLEKNPQSALALNELALTYYKTNRTQEAVEAAKRAYELSQVPGIADTYGWMLQAAGEIEEALAVFVKAVASGTQNPGIRFHYAYVLHKSGKHVEAKAELQRILQSSVSFTQRAEAEKLLGQL